MFDFFKKKKQSPPKEKRFPPVPDWQPSIVQPIDQIVDRVRYYTEGKNDFAVFTNGTIALVPNGFTDEQAISHAEDALFKVFHAHIDMEPLHMVDGHILVRYNHDVWTLVLREISSANWQEISKHYERAIATDEVLITPLGPNVFDDEGKKALFGRCFMFMDAQVPKIVRVERGTPKT